MRKFTEAEVYSAIYLLEDGKTDELAEFCEQDEDIVNRIMWLTAQSHPTVIVQMTCELVRQLMMNMES